MKTKRRIVTPFALVALAVMYLGSATATRAQAVSSCDNMGGIAFELVTYYGPFNSVATDPRADIGDPQHKIELKGLLYYDANNPVGNAPVLIYNHGHEKVRGEPCAIARYFVEKGFVVFAPLRRGHIADESYNGDRIVGSTGIHNDVYVSRCMRSQAQASGTHRNRS